MKEGDLVLCKVKKVTNTVVIVKLPNGKEGTIISSEIAPGRIKHMRHYVVPNKTIVCKVLEIAGDHIHLSLRRVNAKEKKEVMQGFKQEKAINTAFDQLFKEESKSIKEKILKKYKELSDFVKDARENSEIVEEFIPEKYREQIKKIIDKKIKKSLLKKEIELTCLEGDGINRIKSVLETSQNNLSIIYDSAGKFTIKLLVENFKEGKKEMEKILEELEKKAKQNNCEFKEK